MINTYIVKINDISKKFIIDANDWCSDNVGKSALHSTLINQMNPWSMQGMIGIDESYAEYEFLHKEYANLFRLTWL